ncbi:MAG: family 1 glycosylhydrolase [Collinsella sp.]
MATMQLPNSFLWGGDTSDFQCEGGFGEGGRGLLTRDFETDGGVGCPASAHPQDGRRQPRLGELQLLPLPTHPRGRRTLHLR